MEFSKIRQELKFPEVSPRKLSARSSNPWSLKTTSDDDVDSSNRQLYDEDHDSGLDGPLTQATDDSSGSSSLISLGQGSPSDGTKPRSSTIDSELIDCSIELPVRRSRSGTRRTTFSISDDFDFDDGASLDWDYYDSIKGSSDEPRIDEEETGLGSTESTSFLSPSLGQSASSRALTTSQTRSDITTFTSVSMRSVDSQPGLLWKKRRVAIIVVDGTDQGDLALYTYLDKSHKQAYIILLVYCVAIPKIPICDEIPPHEYHTMVLESQEDARCAVESYKRMFEQYGVVHETRILHSDHPGPAIARLANQVNAEFLVIGGDKKHGRFVHHSYLGSIREYLLKHCTMKINTLDGKDPSSQKFNCCGFPMKPITTMLSNASLRLSGSNKKTKWGRDSDDISSLISSV